MCAAAGRTDGENRSSASRDTDSFLHTLLRGSAFLCLAGWSWAHLYWEVPYGALLWSDAVFSFLARLGVHWDAFVGVEGEWGVVQRFNRGVGWIFAVSTLWILFLRRRASKAWILWTVVATTALALLSGAKYLAAQRQLPMFVEHGGQMLTPALLLMAALRGLRHPSVVGLATLAVVMTFVGHGAYAMGLWPTPATYYGMTTAIFHWDANWTVAFLRWAGFMDFLVCVGLFFSKWRRAAALYAVLWGLLTALARPVAGMGLELRFWGADQFVHETLVRAPHFLIPLFLYLAWSPRREGESACRRGAPVDAPDAART